MVDLPDIRRTIRIDRKVTGSELVKALQKFIVQINVSGYRKYAEKLLYNIDGIRTLIIGIQAENPRDCVMIRTGENLGNKGIVLEDSYEAIGIGSSLELLPTIVHAIGYM